MASSDLGPSRKGSPCIPKIEAGETVTGISYFASLKDWSREVYLDYQKEIEKLTEEKYSWKNSAKVLWEAYRKR